MNPETVYGFLAVMFLLIIGALIYAAGNYSARKKGFKKGGIVPNMHPVLPGEKFMSRYRPIIEQQ